ncbi:hypothetical protein BH09BAC1_BH09BAC1_01600 [soil metagenome]
MINLNAQTNIDLRSFVPFSDHANDIWGYVDSAGREYALVGLTKSTEIVDITDPDNPVKLHSIAGPTSTWRDIKTWSHYAYVTNETADGLLIIDLAGLPATINHKYVNFNAAVATAHNVFVDEMGFAYLLGYNDSLRSIPTDQRGAYILDLRSDPWNPTYAGKYAAGYVHDAYVRGDTLWAAQIYAGNFAVVDVKVKASPTVLALQETPSRFTHNSWLSNDGKYIVNSDEVSGGYLSFYSVGDIENITETDRFQSSPGAGVIPHNAFFLGDYVWISYYKDGVVLVDATKKNNIIEVGNYDTSPFIASDGFNGCWGVYPFFPSGTVVASDIEEGLFVLTPTYQRASYLEGKVTNSTSGANLGSVKIDLLGTDNFSISNYGGEYYTGAGQPGLYDVRFTRQGCSTQIFTNVSLTSGQTTVVNAALQCNSLTGINDASLPQPYFTAQPSVFDGHTSLSFFTGEEGLSKSTLSVYDLNGGKVNEWAFETATGEVVIGDNLATGVYMVTLNNATFTRNIKILKNR